MKNMLIGPELVETQEYVEHILIEDGKTSVLCYSHEDALLAWEAIDSYCDEAYNITLYDRTLYLTLEEEERQSELRYQGALYAH